MAQKSKLSPELIREITETVIDIWDEKREKELEALRKRVSDRKLRNTRLLLEHYRSFVALSDGAIFRASQCDEDVYDILSLMSGKPSEQEMEVESIKQSAVRTKLMMEHIKKALDDYEAYCIRTKRAEEMRRWRTIKALYVDDEGLEAEDIAERECVDVSTVYKDIKAATRRLTPRIFGIDGIK